MTTREAAECRRQFLRFLAGSPLLATGALPSLSAEAADLLQPLGKGPDPLAWAPLRTDSIIQSPAEAINVFDFETAARQKVPPAHFGYMASGIDDEVTLRANREGFLKFQLRPRRLVDVSKVDTRIQLFGMTWDSPIAIAPTGGNRAYHPDGDLAVARAAKAGNHLQILSTQSSYSVEDVTRARGVPIWFQLYASPSWDLARALVRRAENAGAAAIAVTIDRVGGRNQETFFRLRRTDPRDCHQCHDDSSPAAAVRTKGNFQGIDVAATGVTNLQSANMTWDFLRRLRDTTKMKILVKGVLAHEDAKLCVENGLDGLIVSNHGGRGEDSGRSTIDALPEILEAVGGRIPVLVDSGFRRGTDAVKALAMGATAVCVGRPYLWGLGAFGQPGVERVLDILRTETRAAMQQVGAPSVKALTPAHVRRA